MRAMRHACAGWLLMSAVPALAATDAEPLLKGCAGLRNGSERLACYDRAVAQLYSQEGDGVEQPKLSPESLFGGARVGELPRFEQERQELSSITARVTLLRTASDGSPLIELDNGQIWKQEDSKNLLLRINDPVTISRAAMQSFKLSTPGQRFARVSRVH